MQALLFTGNCWQQLFSNSILAAHMSLVIYMRSYLPAPPLPVTGKALFVKPVPPPCLFRWWHCSA